MYGIEVNVLANSADGNIIDRAAFLTFEAEPTSAETGKNQNIAIVLLVVAFLIVSFIILRRRKRTIE
jgi:LPXTG-motif cell wall-anchored protein